MAALAPRIRLVNFKNTKTGSFCKIQQTLNPSSITISLLHILNPNQMEYSDSRSLPLLNRTAIVIGASRGIGKAIAIHLNSLGANVVVAYASNSSQAESVASVINSSSFKCITFKADVSDPVQVKSLFDKAEETFNRPTHIVVNCAGVLDNKYPSLADTALDDFDRTFSINTRGSFIVCKEAAARLIRGGGGRIIMTSSSQVGGLSPGFGAYAASKAAVEAMVKVLAKELKGTQITANCVAPGPVATDMFFSGKSEEQVKRVIEQCPLNRLGETSDVAPLVGFLVCDSGEWVNGQSIRINGGYV